MLGSSRSRKASSIGIDKIIRSRKITTEANRKEAAMRNVYAVVRRAAPVGVAGVLIAVTSAFGVEVTFDKAFIEENKNRATITLSDFRVRGTHNHAKPIDDTGKRSGDDGDIHCSGWSDALGFALVAEISNARLAQNGVDELVAAKGHAPITVTGLWRIWPEHARQEPFRQGNEEIPVLNDTNPDHVFEIHPLTNVAGVAVPETFTEINDGTKEFAYKDAKGAFEAYDKHEFSIRSTKKTVTVRTPAIGYNYVRFRVKLLETPSHPLDDGGISFYASVFAADDTNAEAEVPLTGKVRFILAKGTEPFDKLQQKHALDVVELIGLPRLDLALLSWRVAHGKSDPAVLDWTIPYEIAVLAVVE